MNNIVQKLLQFYGLTLMATAAFAQLGLPTRVTVRAEIHDPDGNPVESATVLLGSPRYGLGEKSEESSALTDKNGVAELSVLALQSYQIVVTKPGYYRTDGPDKSVSTEQSYQKNATGMQRYSGELRPVRNPTRSIGTGLDRLRIPVAEAPVGFDLEAGDWVAPYGKGQTADLSFSMKGYVKSNRDYDLSLTMAFSNLGDGILLFKASPETGSAFKFPYEAPLDGYLPQRTWRKSFDGKTDSSTVDLSGETHYIFRVRTELDEKGNIRRALYGIIGNDVNFFGTRESGFNVSLIYRLNPDWNRNIEFAKDKVAKP